MSAVALSVFVVTVIVLPIALNEAGELAPWLAARLVHLGASLVGSSKERARYREEWLANLEFVPGKITKVAWAFGLLLWSVPRLRWQIRSRDRRAAALATPPIARGRLVTVPLALRTRYERQYRQYVLSSLRFVDSKGLATVGESVPELDEVFVDVALAARAPHQVGSGVLADAAGAAERRSIAEFLDRRRPAVLAVVGAPGSGKSTLLRHLALQTARGMRGRRAVPVLLELRDQAGRILDNPAVTLPALVRGALPPLAVAEPTGWWEARLKRGGCVVLLDGPDEVAGDEDRRAVANWIEAQIAAFPGNDVVVASRPLGYRSAAVGPALVLQARPFTTEQVERFLHGWYRAVERHVWGTVGTEVDTRAQQAARDLVERLSHAPALRDLMVNPLLLTMIANVHRYRGALPGSRADLYGEMCQVMLWRRAEARRQRAAVPGPAKARLLAQLAYTMMAAGVCDLPRDRVLAELASGLRRVTVDTREHEFLEEIVSAGLLVEREKDTYAFAHLTFQEYLAAHHIREKELEGVLTSCVDDPWWNATTLLYAASADANPIVDACLASDTKTALLLAAACAEIGEVSPNLRDRLLCALQRFL